MKYSWKSHKDRSRHKNRINGSGQARLGYVRHKLLTSPPPESEPAETRIKGAKKQKKTPPPPPKKINKQIKKE